MSARVLIISGWIASISALIAMFIGHSGDHELSWKINQISTYAATAPHDQWVTASMLLSSLALVIIGLLIARHKALGDSFLTHMAPFFIGSAVSGLLVLAAFEETARTISKLKNSSFDAIRQQSFHDAGLLIFFYSVIIAIAILGLLVIAHNGSWRRRMIGGPIFLLGPASFLLMTTSWPRLLGLTGTGAGLKQRAALFCLWLAFVLALAIASSISPQPKKGLSNN